MRFSSFTYLVGQGLHNLKANKMMTLASMGVLIVCMILVGAAFLFGANIDSMVAYIGEQNETVAFINDDADTAAVEEAIRSIPHVAGVEFISKDQMLDEYSQRLEGYTNLKEMFQNDNPLLANYVVRADDPANISSVAAALQNVDGVRAVNNDTLRQLGREFGADGVQISLHALCAEDHLPYQGRRFTNKQFERLQNRLPRPFGMWNCKHTIFPVVLGVSEPAHTPEELAALTYRSKKEIAGQVRIVTIPGADVCACCGTHTAATGQVGQIKILTSENYKGGVRLSVVCGGRALREAQAMRSRQADIGALLSAKADTKRWIFSSTAKISLDT